MNPTAWIVTDIFRSFSATSENNPKVQILESCVVEKRSYFEIYKMGLSPYTWNKIYSRQVIEQHHLRFDENCYFAEDVGFNVQYCMLCDSCVFLPKKLYIYYQNPDGIMHRYYDNWLEMHFPIFTCRLPLIQSEDMAEYCDIWLYHFISWLDIVFDKRNTLSFPQKMKYNQRMINSEVFQFCLRTASGIKESPLTISLFRTKNYYLYWAVTQLVRLKQKLGGDKE